MPFFSLFSLPINIFFLPCLCVFSLGRKLRGKAFYFVNGKVFCEEDFLVSLFTQMSPPQGPGGECAERPAHQKKVLPVHGPQCTVGEGGLTFLLQMHGVAHVPGQMANSRALIFSGIFRSPGLPSCCSVPFCQLPPALKSHSGSRALLILILPASATH